MRGLEQHQGLVLVEFRGGDDRLADPQGGGIAVEPPAMVPDTVHDGVDGVGGEEQRQEDPVEDGIGGGGAGLRAAEDDAPDLRWGHVVEVGHLEAGPRAGQSFVVDGLAPPQPFHDAGVVDEPVVADGPDPGRGQVAAVPRPRPRTKRGP